jgi:hypothetical protein
MVGLGVSQSKYRAETGDSAATIRSGGTVSHTGPDVQGHASTPGQCCIYVIEARTRQKHGIIVEKPINLRQESVRAASRELLRREKSNGDDDAGK